MNIDERLVALLQSVKDLARRQRGNLQGENGNRLDQVTRNFEITLDSIKRLEKIAVARVR